MPDLNSFLSFMLIVLFFIYLHETWQRKWTGPIGAIVCVVCFVNNDYSPLITAFLLFEFSIFIYRWLKHRKWKRTDMWRSPEAPKGYPYTRPHNGTTRYVEDQHDKRWYN